MLVAFWFGCFSGVLVWGSCLVAYFYVDTFSSMFWVITLRYNLVVLLSGNGLCYVFLVVVFPL